MEPKTRVTQEEVVDLLNACTVQEHVFWGKELVVSYKLPNGFTISGRAACVSSENFVLEIGRQIAKKKVEETVWLLLGYQLQCELFNKGFVE